MWKSKKLVYRAPSGTLRTWQIFAVDDGYYTETGVLNDSKRASAITKCRAKNVGASNERSAEQVAIDTAKSKMQSKLDEGYVDSLKKIEEQDKVPRAMLAQPKLEKRKTAVLTAVTLGNCYVQPKLDGFRCLATKDGLWTRHLREIDNCNHIREALKPFFEKFPEVVVDGELYNHDYKDDFGKLQSLLTKQNIDMLQHLEVAEKVQFHVYDFIDERDFWTRLSWYGSRLMNETKGGGPIKLVHTYMAEKMEEIFERHAEFRQEGYEGTMIRISRDGYEQNKRSGQLIKLKDVLDEEFIIRDILPGKGQWEGAAKTVECYDPKLEVEFSAGCAGRYEQLALILENKERYIGGKVTVEFQEKFPTGIPRFPVAKKFYSS